jgi:hypothetical protein
MATKLYFHELPTTNSGNLPIGDQAANVPGVTATGATTIRTMDTAIGVGQTSVAINTLGSTAIQTALFRMFSSPPLDGAQTVGGGTITLNVADSESNLNGNFAICQLNVYVWRPSTGVIVGTLADNSIGAVANSIAREPTLASSEQVSTINFSTSAVSAQDGDVVICEIWSYHQQAMGSAYVATFYFDGTTENNTENAVVSNHASYLLLNENLTFKAPAAFSPIDPMGMMGIFGI